MCFYGRVSLNFVQHLENSLSKTPFVFTMYCVIALSGVKACVSQPCKNGGTCARSTSPLNDYVCQCIAGYDGVNCECKSRIIVIQTERDQDARQTKDELLCRVGMLFLTVITDKSQYLTNVL